MPDTLIGCGVNREKYWSELTPDQRIERLRSEFKRLERVIDRTSRTAARALNVAENHEHSAHMGHVTMRARSEGQCESESAYGPKLRTSASNNPDDVYI